MQSGKSSLLVYVDAVRVHCVALWARVEMRIAAQIAIFQVETHPWWSVNGSQSSDAAPLQACRPLRLCDAPNCDFQVAHTNAHFQSPVFRAEGWPCMARVCSVDAPIFSQGGAWEGAQLQSWWSSAAWPSTMSTRCAPDCKLYFPRPPQLIYSVNGFCSEKQRAVWYGGLGNSWYPSTHPRVTPSTYPATLAAVQRLDVPSTQPLDAAPRRQPSTLDVHT